MKIIEHNTETDEIVIRELSQQEIDAAQLEAVASAWFHLRNQRDNLLSSSDWTVLSDTPTSTAAWKTYRQALRDLPANTTDPFNPVWPTPPA